jgi:competence protein ComEA
MPSLPVSRRRALVLGAAALALLAVAGRTLAGAGAAAEQPPQALVAEPAAAAPKLVVHVAGAVRRPGLYRLAEGKRVADAVARAGGATAPADTAAINLAAPLADGMQVLVPKRIPGGGRETAAGRVSLSSATAAELDALPGIGPVTVEQLRDVVSP